jgi:hypothetical protein
MNVLRKIWDGFANFCDMLGEMGDATVAVKPDNYTRFAVLCRCPSCKLSQLVDPSTVVYGSRHIGVRHCAGCDHIVTIDNDSVGEYEVIR